MNRPLKDYKLDPPDPAVYPVCPCCGSTDYSTVYLDGNKMVGCDNCISERNAEEYLEELLEDDNGGF